jgi:hypothetical protein
MASRCFFPREAEAGGRHHHHQSKAAAEALEQLHHGGRVLSREDVGGAVRVKIVVSKRELKHMVAALGSGTGGDGRGGAAPSARGGRRRRPRRRAEAAVAAAAQHAEGGGGGAADAGERGVGARPAEHSRRGLLNIIPVDGVVSDG